MSLSKLKKKLEKRNVYFEFDGLDSFPTNKSCLKAVMPLLEEIHEAWLDDDDIKDFKNYLRELLEENK